MEITPFVEGLIEQFPVLLILLYVIIRQDKRIDELLDDLQSLRKLVNRNSDKISVE